MKMPDSYQIPDDPDAGRMDAAYLRACLGMRVEDGQKPPPFPRAVRQAHYNMARALSALGAMGRSMNPTQLATVITLASVEVQDIEVPEHAFVRDKPPVGQKVVIHWRKKDQPAHFLGMTPDSRVLVLHNGNEIKMRPDLVRNAKPNDFPEVPQNINQTVEV